MRDLTGFHISRAFSLSLDNLNRNSSVYTSEVICYWFITAFLSETGLWLDPLAPSGAGNFIRHTAIYHAGAVVFLFGDIFLLFGAGTLTVMQAMQVRGSFTNVTTWKLLYLD